MLNWFYKLFRRQKPRVERSAQFRREDPYRSLVDFPAPFECPADVRRQLHQIASDLEIVYFMDGEWWLGRVKHTRQRYKIGARLAVAAQHYQSFTDVAKLRHGLLAMEGFGYICSFNRDPDGGVLDYARYLRWEKENDRLDEAFEDSAFASDDARKLEYAIKLAREKNQADSRGIWKHARGKGTIYSH